MRPIKTLAILNPIEILPCKFLACSICIIDHVKADDSDLFCCQGCGEAHNKCSSSFSQLSPISIKMLNDMIVTCTNCSRHVKLSSNGRCDDHVNNETSLTEVVMRPLEATPTTLEKQVATNVVTRLLHQNSENISLTLPRITGGQVYTCIN
jgi:hypothetical protein